MNKKVQRQKKPSRKRGDKSNEIAVKHRKVKKGFKQTKDIREDRGVMQKKFGKKR